MGEKSLSIGKEFIVLDPDKKAAIEPFDSGLYERLEQNYNGFKGHELISCHEFSQDWSSWEIHPQGDEVLILLSGKVEFLLDLETEKKSVALENAGEYTIVPRNIWHTANTNVQTKVLFITPGEGTEHRSRQV